MKKLNITLLTAFAAAAALASFSGVAEAAIMGVGLGPGGVDLGPGDETITGLSMAGGDTLTIDNGSTLTQTGGLAIIGTFSGTDGAAVVNISSGGIFQHTDPAPGDGGNAFSLGNTGGITNQYGVVTVTGTGSLMSTLKNMRVGRTGFVTGTTIASTLTIEDGGLVMAEKIQMGSDASGVGNVRMGPGGILAIEGTKTLATMTTVGNGTGELQYWTGSAWDDITNATAVTDYTLAAGSGTLSGYTVLTMTAIPEPGTMSLLAIGGLGMLFKRRRRRA
jgi:T5SS/PEP-CTERM-associated repeat protein